VKRVLIHNVSDPGRETKRSAFDGPTGESDGHAVMRCFAVMPAFLATATAVGVSRVGKD
jgi:hypothetical protein